VDHSIATCFLSCVAKRLHDTRLLDHVLRGLLNRFERRVAIWSRPQEPVGAGACPNAEKQSGKE
jgi:hypothetical protein